MRKIIIFSLLTLMIVGAANGFAIEPLVLNNPTEDGRIDKAGAVYVRTTNGQNSQVYEDGVPNGIRGYWEFPTTAIPDNATILEVELTWTADRQAGAATFTLRQMSSQPSTSADNVVWSDCADGNIYVTRALTAGVNTYTDDLGATSCTDMEALLANDWFAIGVRSNTADLTNLIYFEESATQAYRPILTVRYVYTDYNITLNGPLYENNTAAAAIYVTALSATGEAYTFLMDDDPYIIGFDEKPEYVTWEASTGYWRRYYILENASTMTVLLPEDTFAVFTPVVRDYVGITQRETCYFYTMRTVGGSELVVERMPIVDTINGFPSSLVVNRIYTLGVNTTGTDYTFSFYTTTAIPSPILIMNTPEFNDVFQFNTGYIHVTATRSTDGTDIDWAYQDDLLDTANVTMIVMHMNGTIVYTNTQLANNDFTHNWGAATNTTSYIVSALIDHNQRGNLTYTMSFSGLFDYEDVPSLVGLGGAPALAQQAIGGLTVLSVAYLFSSRGAIVGSVVTTIVAAFLAGFGWLNLNTGLIVFVLFIAFTYEMGRGRG